MDEPTTPEVAPAIGEPDQPRPPRLVARRRVLQVLGVGVVTVRFSHTIDRTPFSPVRALLESTLTHPAELVGPLALNESFRTEVVRARDFLHLTFIFYNLDLRTTGPDAGKLVRTNPANAAYVVVEFPPQHVVEQTFTNPPNPPFPAPPIAAFLAGPSRLAFKVPTTRTSIPYSLPALLDWSRLSLTPNLVVTADAPGGPLVAPTATQTSIEVPFNLFLSPGKAGEWAHATQPVTQGTRVELWHTRLGTHHNTAPGDPPAPPDEAPAVPAQVRAVWPQPATPDPFLLPLAATFREKLVRNMATWTNGSYTPVPAAVNLLALTALGASTDLKGDWDDLEVAKVSSDIVEWRQRSSIGRDNFSRIVEVGYLFPFGHLAVRVTSTERQFQAASQSGDITTYLVQKQYIQVRVANKSYPAFGHAHTGRRFPFSSVRIDTLVTPSVTITTEDFVWVTLASDGSDLLWKVTLTDLEDRKVTMTMPLAFMTAQDDTAYNISFSYFVGVAAYESTDPNGVRRLRDGGGQKIAFADTANPTDPNHPPKQGGTTFPTSTIVFGADTVDIDPGVGAMKAHHQPYFYPAVATATVHMPAAEQVTGSPVAGGAGIPISFNATYLTDGFALSNFGGVFADVASPPTIAIPPALSGGIATPQQAINAVSRDLGPVGGTINNLQALKKFDPADVLGGLPKLFGSIALTDILPIVNLGGLADLAKIPGVTNELIYPGGDHNKAPEALRSHLHWTPDLHNSTGAIAGLFTADRDGKPATLRLDIETFTPIASPDKSTIDLDADLQSFTISLFGSAAPFIDLKFDRLRFRSKTGSKPSVDVGLGDVVFKGPLTFVTALTDLLGSLDGPNIEVSPQGIGAGYSISLPTLSVGVVSLQNISFGGAVFLPFTDGQMRVRFNFCTREHPFLVTVSLFGGGGFFAVALGVDGLEMMEASIEFGGNFAFDIGVASGGVHVMAGIYFKLSRGNPDNIELTGFLRLGGELEVLGLITVSIEFVLSFTYKSVGKAYGKATLTVKVEIAFFSTSVELSVEKQFAGGEGDPSFQDVMAESDWTKYCRAFAA